MTRFIEREDEQARPRQQHRGKPVTFSQDALKEFVTGFRKRRQQRQAAGAAQLARKERLLRNQGRKERRDALNAEIEQKLRKRQRITDDDDAGDGWSSSTPKKQRADGGEEGAEAEEAEGGNPSVDAASAAADDSKADAQPPLLPPPSLPRRPSQAWKYEDDVALVTVHTRSLTDDDDPHPHTDEEGTTGAGDATPTATATEWGRHVPLGFTGGGRPGTPGSGKKVVGKKKQQKKKDKRGPRRLMKGKKEKALGVAKKKGKSRR